VCEGEASAFCGRCGEADEERRSLESPVEGLAVEEEPAVVDGRITFVYIGSCGTGPVEGILGEVGEDAWLGVSGVGSGRVDNAGGEFVRGVLGVTVVPASSKASRRASASSCAIMSLLAGSTIIDSSSSSR
jgi:hypothetical protein